MTNFQEQVRALLNSHLGLAAYTVVAYKEYLGGQGAAVEADCADLKIRVTHERMFDFYVEVASTGNPSKWYRLLELLLVASGEPIERSKVLVGHSMAELDDHVHRFATHREQISALLLPERVVDTERQLAEVREQSMLPALKPYAKR